MSSTSRQNSLLISQDWTKIYQSYRNADFTSYDFDNVRRMMIDYLRNNYPEDFNDYIESSEYIALIDLIAYLGQTIAFRIDLNARDNFLELAERRESILRLARLISYNSKRSVAANGLLKFTTIQTTENLSDSNGRNLANQVISWNDASNPNWYDQFFTILNAAFPATQQFGNPADSATIYTIPAQQYRFNSSINGVPVFSFNNLVAGQNMRFEITSTTFKNQTYIYEEPPLIGNTLACVYLNDGQGAGSSNTGFFLRFTQGTLNQGTFNITQPTSNQTIDIDTNNINNNDIWLYGLNTSGVETTLWTQVPALQGNNVIYNSLNKNIKDIYSVLTRTNDAVSLQFSDGTFGNLPSGPFRVYYRTSNGLTYTINPQDIPNVAISFSYVSHSGQQETITLTLALTNSVSNASASETNDSIKTNAPQTYYTQDRMITGEDYNISPLAASTQVLKIKSVNRTASGISRYFDLTDPTGAYSTTTLFAEDGVIYSQPYESQFLFNYVTQTDIQSTIYNNIIPFIQDPNTRNFYYQQYSVPVVPSLNVTWVSQTGNVGNSTGYIKDSVTNLPLVVGSSTTTNLRYLQLGSLLQFVAPTGYYFDTTNYNTLTQGTATAKGAVTTLWAQVTSVSGDGTANGTGLLSTGFGPIVINKEIPTGSVLTQIIPAFNTNLTQSVVTTMIDLVLSNQPFGLSYNATTSVWQIVYETNLNQTGSFSLLNQGSTANTLSDSSWMLLFTTDNVTYTVTTRQLRYVFESAGQVSFYYDATKKLYDITTNSFVTDSISLLSVNTQPGQTSAYTQDQIWQVTGAYLGLDGFVDPSKLIVSFAPNTSNGAVDNPELFLQAVYTSTLGTPTTYSAPTYIVEQKYTMADGSEDYRYVANNPAVGPVIIMATQPTNTTGYTTGQYFYFTSTDTVAQFDAATSTFSATLDYKVYVGRDQLKFKYVHNADYDERIDPGVTNIIDIYVLTQSYDTQYRQWIAGALSTEPMPPSSAEINDLLAPQLNLIKSISDEIVYHPVKYTPLFGQNAAADLQAEFQVIKNPTLTLSDSDIQTQVIAAVNQFFSINNWDFGDTFYFTELSTYVMQQLAPNITSMVIVPRSGNLNFGSLFEITSTSDSLFISTATVADVSIVSNITATNIKAIPTTLTQTTVISNQVITSAPYGTLNG